MKKKFFTVYWLDGRRSIISGEDILDAFNQIGYNCHESKLFEWYDLGITNTHYWDSGLCWREREPIELTKEDISNLTYTNISSFIDMCSVVRVTFDNKDILSICKKISTYAVIGVVESIDILYAEYHQGTQHGDSEDEKNQHHYMVTGGQHWKPENIELAITVFKARLNSVKPWISLPGSESLEDIAASQPQYR